MSMSQTTELVSKVALEVLAAPRKCSALGLTDSQPCQSDATSLNGLFCQFHSRQCHGMFLHALEHEAQLLLAPE